MNRYITRRYVAVDWANALRLAQLDGTALSNIKSQQAVELRHRTDWWAWWSDKRLTTAIGLPEDLRPETLSADAISLIDDVWMGNAIAPQCGWALLTTVHHIFDCQPMPVSCMSNGVTVFRREKLRLVFSNAQSGVLYRSYSLDRSGYKCDISSEPL